MTDVDDITCAGMQFTSMVLHSEDNNNQNDG